MTFDIQSAAAGMGILATICAAVWFVITLMVKPLKERQADLVKHKDESTRTLAKLEQRQDNQETTSIRHFAEDAAQLAKIEGLMRDLGLKIDTGMKEQGDRLTQGLAELRRELREDTGEFRVRGEPRVR